jgi:hypothetical protein
MDQETFNLGPLYIDKNLLGRKHELKARGGPIFVRDDLSLEGSDSAVTLGRPLWSLDDEWSWSFEGGHRYAIERSFLGAGLRTFDAPSTPQDDMLPYAYQQRRWTAGVGVTSAFGDGVEHRVKGAYVLTSQRPALLDDFPGTGTARDEFVARVLPRNERTGIVYAGYEIFTARYREYTDVDSYDINEDARLGPRAAITLGAGLRLLGSDVNFGTASVEGGWTTSWARDGLATLAGSFTTRLERRSLVDRVAAVSARVVTPQIGPGRLITELRFAGIFKDASNRFLVLGGDNGLRGYPVGFLDGDRRGVLQTEFRTRSVRLFWGSRWGALAYYEVGGADNKVDDVALFQDVGIGIRALGAQLSPEVYRIDLAFPLTTYTVRGVEHGLWPPRFIAGYRQAF